jgi:exo-1,4-beta-D-glucosaminidase
VPGHGRRAMIFPHKLSRYVLALPVAMAFSVLPSQAGAASRPSALRVIPLSDGWMLQSACKVHATGAQISVPGFDTDTWHTTKVPSTVLAALVEDKTYPDPYFGMNLRSIPGTTYPIGKNFSLLPMPDDSPFRCSWWYRAVLPVPESFHGLHVWLDVDGINNRANIWLNGQQIASTSTIAGAYRAYQFDLSRWLSTGAPNVVAIEVFAQTAHDLGINWNDWNPAPPDKDMGLWRGVSLRATGPIEIASPQVVTHFPRSSLDEADLTVEAQVRNLTSERITGEVVADLEGNHLAQSITLGPHETSVARFAPDRFPSLHLVKPELWWPRQMGAPVLHDLTMSVSAGGVVSDSRSIRYGIREVTSELDKKGHRLFRVNGQRILIRGAGWAPDMLLRESSERLETEFRYVGDLNLNAIRLEGPMVPEAFFDLADQQGVLILAGWTCCDFWMDWKKWSAADLAIAKASLRSEILGMRSHPSVLVWMNGSDEAPPEAIERAYVAELKELDWSNPYLASASEKPVALGDGSGMKMLGPYDYTPPDYWLADSNKFGGAFGFASEVSPGPAIPLESSLKKMLLPRDIEPSRPAWNYHAGGERFTHLTHFDEAMRAIYGQPADFAHYEQKSQAMAYDAERAMFEAYSRNKYESTGVIQWMLNNAWPSLIWHLYDYYLQPAGGYFGAKKACEPIHAQYSYNDRTIEVVNSTYQKVAGLTVSATLYDAQLGERFSKRVAVTVDRDGVEKALVLPPATFSPASPIYFVKLVLEDSLNHILSTNFYWLSARSNVYDWVNTDAYTAISSYEDLTALDSLPSAGRIEVATSREDGTSGALVRVRLRNPSDHLAFQVRLGIHHSRENTEILPVLWQDNYMELMPGESREIVAQFPSPDALRGESELTIDGWNIDSSKLAIAPAARRATDTGGTE